MTEDEGHCNLWVQGVLDASEEEFQYILNNLPSIEEIKDS